MRKVLYISLCCLLVTALLGCGTTKEETLFNPAPASPPNIKLRVTDVSNKTGEIYDVDVIGMMWNALDASLHRRGLLWDGNAQVQPLQVQAEILEYQKGSLYLRNILPPWGKTAIKARCVVKDGERVIASSETTQSITLGDGSFTLKAWGKIFNEAAEDLVSQVARQL